MGFWVPQNCPTRTVPDYRRLVVFRTPDPSGEHIQIIRERGDGGAVQVNVVCPNAKEVWPHRCVTTIVDSRGPGRRRSPARADRRNSNCLGLGRCRTETPFAVCRGMKTFRKSRQIILTPKTGLPTYPPMRANYPGHPLPMRLC